ncbi:MAG: protein kinase domain-containing protein [Polyangiales bacterium]
MGGATDLPVTFGRYVLRRRLAEGGMAEIFLAEQRGAADVSKTVVLKRMLPHLGREPAYVRMFLDEARLASKLSHPNVVQVFDFGEVNGRYFLAMEYLAGETVGTVLRKCRDVGWQVPVPVMLRVAADACDGLHYAHEYAEGGVPMNIVHRDVSPANIMVTYQGIVKVVDFGIARARDRLQERTATGVVKGKLAYCAPEQFRGSEVDRRADVFSLGVVLWEMATVERLFRRRTDEATMWAVVNDEVPDPSDRRPELPRGLGDVLRRALTRDPAERHPTARALRDDLEALIREHGGAAARPDEFLLSLFGEERARQRSDVRTPVSELSWVDPASSSAPSEPDGAEGHRTAATVPGKHLRADEPQPETTAQPEARGASDRRARPRRRWAWVAAAALALGLGAGVAAWLTQGADPRYERAFQMAQRGDFDKARTELEAYLADEPDDAEAQLMRLLVAWWASAPDIEAELAQARAAPLDEAQRATVEGIWLINEGRHAEAAQYVRPVLEAHPDSPELLYVLGEAQWHRGRLHEGADTLLEAVETDPRWLMALHHAVDFFLDQREHDRLRALADRLQPVDDVMATSVRARVLLGARRYDAARDLLDDALAEHPDSVVLWTASADVAAVRGELPRMKKAAQRAFELSPLDSRQSGGYSRLAEYYVYRGEIDEFRNESRLLERTLLESLWEGRGGTYREKPSLDGKVRTPPYMLACYLASRHAAGDAARSVWKHAPEPDVHFWGKGLAAELRGEHRTAADAFAAGLAAPQGGHVRMLLAWGLARARRRLGDVDGAARACEQVLHPRLYHPYRALLVPDCVLWTAETEADPSHARTRLDTLLSRWTGDYPHPAIQRARTGDVLP